MTIEVSKSEKEFVEHLRRLSQSGRDYIMQKMCVVRTWEGFTTGWRKTDMEQTNGTTMENNP